MSKTCGTCAHYEPIRNPETGRVRPSQPGQCGYIVEWPVLPICYETWPGSPVQWPYRSKVWPGRSAERCPHWSGRTRTIREAVRQETLRLEANDD